MQTKEYMPSINLQPLWDDVDNGVEIVANEITRTFKDVGFAYLTNHNIPDHLIENMFKAAVDFHNLPLGIKMKIVQNKCFRGYLPRNESQIKISTQGKSLKPNQSEAFIMMFDVPETHPDYKTGAYLAGPNQWPESMPSLKKTMYAYRDAMIVLASKLVEVFAVAFGLPSQALNDFFVDPTFFLRLHGYPANCGEDEFGVAPHTDLGFITILAQDNVGGLEIKHPEKGWVEVPYVPSTLVLNAGDMLNRWSNNTFKSIPHRVINKSDRKRYSVPFFFDPNMHAMIKVLDSCISTESKAIFPPVMYGDYVLDRVQKNYSRLHSRQ